MKIRDLKYIYNSRVDFVDAWLSILSILTAIVLIVTDPIENIEAYSSLIKAGITSNGLGIFSLVVGLFNLIRLLLPFKLNVFCSSFMKTLSFSIFVLLFFAVVGQPPLPLATVFYFMVSALTFDNLMRTK